MPRGKVPKSTAIAKAVKLKKVPEREPFFVIGGMPIYEEMRALRCGEKPRKWEGAGSMPRCNFRSSGGERKRIPGTGSRKSYRVRALVYGSSKNAMRRASSTA